MHKVVNADNEHYDVEEPCPHCDCLVAVALDKNDPSFEVTCPSCHKKIMLCSACEHTGDCDWEEGKGCKMRVQFDEMVDVAYAEIYTTVRELEKEGKCDSDLDTESLCYECKKLAVEFIETYRKLNEYSEPDFYNLLSRFAYAKPVEKWPPLKRFDVLIDANVTMTWPTFAANRDQAEEQARVFMRLPQFPKQFRDSMVITETNIGDVIEREAKK